jgi:hypothetical protein
MSSAPTALNNGLGSLANGRPPLSGNWQTPPAREQMVAKAVAEFSRRLAVLEHNPRDLEPSFQE